MLDVCIQRRNGTSQDELSCNNTEAEQGAVKETGRPIELESEEKWTQSISAGQQQQQQKQDWVGHHPHPERSDTSWVPANDGDNVLWGMCDKKFSFPSTSSSSSSYSSSYSWSSSCMRHGSSSSIRIILLLSCLLLQHWWLTDGGRDQISRR